MHLQIFLGILNILKYHKYFINLTEFTKYPVYKIKFSVGLLLYIILIFINYQLWWFYICICKTIYKYIKIPPILNTSNIPIGVLDTNRFVASSRNWTKIRRVFQFAKEGKQRMIQMELESTKGKKLKFLAWLPVERNTSIWSLPCHRVTKSQTCAAAHG